MDDYRERIRKSLTLAVQNVVDVHELIVAGVAPPNMMTQAVNNLAKTEELAREIEGLGASDGNPTHVTGATDPGLKH